MTKVCVVVGSGTKYASNQAFHGDAPSDDLPDAVKWGLGGALPIAFARAGYAVVAMSRSDENLAPIVERLRADGHECLGLRCDVTDPASVKNAFSAAVDAFGEIDVLCYNAGYDQSPPAGQTVTNPMGGELTEDLDPGRFRASFEVHDLGLLHCAQAVLSSMRERGSGALLVSGNTMSIRGGAKFGINAPSKFAQRAMTQVMAQEYKPHGVHVAHVIIDGAIDAPGLRAMFVERGNSAALEAEAESPGATFLDPAEIASTFVYLADQHPSVWTHEITLTPYKVRLGQRL